MIELLPFFSSMKRNGNGIRSKVSNSPSEHTTYELIFTLSIIIVIVYLFDRYVKRRHYYQAISKLPSPSRSFPGHLFDFFIDMCKTGFDSGKTFYDIQHRYTKKFEKQGLFSVSFEPIANSLVVITSPKAYKDVLTDQDNTYKNFTYNLLHDLIGGRNLIASGGMEWKHDRKIIDPSFKYSVLMSMNGSISKRVDLLIDCIKKSGNKVKDMHALLAPVITHVILESAIGFDIDPKDEKLHKYVDGQRKFTDALIIRIIFPLFYVFPPLFNWTIGWPVQSAIKQIKEFVSDAVDRRIDLLVREERVKNGNDDGCGQLTATEDRKQSLSDTLIKSHLNDPKIITKQVIIDQVTTFVFVGHKATSITLNAILFLLACHEDVQKKLQSELDQVFGNALNQAEQLESDLLNTDKLNQCTYLSAVIKEGMRLYPISASIGRRVTKEFKVNGYNIPIGSEIIFDFNSLTKHPESFPYKPYEFIPERFIPGQVSYDENRHQYSVIPFSHGLRKCIGEKYAINILKVFLIKLLINYNLKTSKTMENVTLVQDIMVYFRTPIDIEFIDRKS